MYHFEGGKKCMIYLKGISLLLSYKTGMDKSHPFILNNHGIQFKKRKMGNKNWVHASLF